MLTVLGRANSSNVQAVMWTIAELCLPHERLDYGHVHGGLDTPDYGALNPHRRVPVLRDGDLALWESMAIVRYLAGRYGDGGAFWPADPVARAPIDMWAEWGKVSFGPAFSLPIFWARVRTPAAERDKAALAAALAQFEELLDRLEAPLASTPFLVGRDLTVADIAVGHLLFRWFTIDVPRRPRPSLETYYARLCARPAYRDNVMVDYEALRAPGA